MMRRWLFAVGLLLCAWIDAALVAAISHTPAELEALILTPEELGEGFAIVLDEPDERAPSFFRVMERRSPSLAAVGITLVRDPVATPREAVAVLIRPFLVGYVPGMPYAPAGFPAGAFAIPLGGGEGGQPTTGIALAWQEAGALALMTVLIEHSPDLTDAEATAEVERWTGLQRDKLAGTLGEQPAATGQAAPVGRPMAPPAQVPAQAPTLPLDR
jgi:hypothetical protein